MKALITIVLLAVLCGCSNNKEPDPPPKYRTYEVTFGGRIDTMIATRCEYAHWTTGGRAIKAFDNDVIIASYGVKKGQSYTIRIID